MDSHALGATVGNNKTRMMSYGRRQSFCCVCAWLWSLSKLNARFVALTTYKCTVRLRGPPIQPIRVPSFLDLPDFPSTTPVLRRTISGERAGSVRLHRYAMDLQACRGEQAPHISQAILLHHKTSWALPPVGGASLGIRGWAAGEDGGRDEVREKVRESTNKATT
ncbi:uncharacterized protein CC84DRAFT_279879 [Paraphaeosphaeria sporulosa]|uniref:Uncharacterized protein n=1 Tax=Paraphaeosphaeria sporulosa TaxID=1460663 RepID=A0A177C0M8_9PLEO|nr:uncharacterized protein CC84DRAFT_279879 [Paraphaeosphaeria sporulosa]OAG01193.1 hypothetical protein CC84DRAFT_279879 [Paraphaeosphaeria sporulosa]